VADVGREPGLVGELLQLDLPQPHVRAIRAAAVGRNRQFVRPFGMALSSHALKPKADLATANSAGLAVA
jgi:hypothetical protein